MYRQMQANLASRGWLEPAFYYMGSDFRSSNDGYLLSYMSQMGGWAVLDYGLFHTPEYADYIQLGYASYLSSFALMNTGEDGKGYWYPDEKNDGASGWAYEPKLFARTWIGRSLNRGPWMYDGEIDLGYGGALRAAATVLVNDPVFGWVCFGGSLQEQSSSFGVTPKDGVRQKFYLRSQGQSFSMQLLRDGFAKNKEIKLIPGKLVITEIENRAGTAHSLPILFKGLNTGLYIVKRNGAKVGSMVVTKENTEQSIAVDLPPGGATISIEKTQ
jgi:hypothetical protein